MKGRYREKARERGRRRREFGSFDALAGFVKGEVDPEEVKRLDEARKERSRRRAEKEFGRAFADEQLARIAGMAASSGTLDSDFYRKYEKAVQRPGVSAPSFEAEKEPEGPRFLLKDVRTDSVMAAFDEFSEKEKAKDAKARARRAALYSPVPMEFHRKRLFAKGEFEGDCHDPSSKVWHVKTRCSHCGREFEFDTRVFATKNIKAFCSPRCQYDYCYRTKSGKNRIAKVTEAADD